MKGASKVIADQCRYGLKSRDKNGEGRARKSTGFMTNSPVIAMQLQRRCPNKGGYNIHKHVLLQGGRTRAAKVYPPELCKAICRGLMKQIAADRDGQFLFTHMEYDESQFSRTIMNVAKWSWKQHGTTFPGPSWIRRC